MPVLSFGAVLAAIEKGQQRTWDHIPIKETACGKSHKEICRRKVANFNVLVETRNTCQVTNQSSHGELSFHHNPHPSALLGLAPFTSRVIRSEGARMKNAAHLHTVIVVSYAR